MVVQVLADAGQVRGHLDAELAQVRGRSDTREHQQLRRIDRAAGQDDLACGVGGVLDAVAPVAHTRRRGAAQQHLRHEAVGAHRQIRAVERGTQISVGGGPASAVLAGDLVPAHALLRRAVEIVVRLESGGDGALHPGVGEFVGVAPVLDVERAPRTVEVVVETGVGFRATEVGQDIVVAPAGRAVLVAPAVVVGAVAADVDHGVHRRAAAERLHPRPERLTAVHVLLLGGLVVPVPLGLEQAGERRGNVDLVGVVLAARLEQQHRYLRPRAQPIGQHAARASGAHDHIVEGILFRHPRLLLDSP